MKKKQYQKPAMQVVQLQHHHQLLSGSPGAKSLVNEENIGWDADGIEGDDY